MRTHGLRRIALRSVGWTRALAFLTVLLYSSHGAAQTEFYPGRLGITKARHLSPDEREVEGRFAAYLETHTGEAVNRYTAKYGKEISTDAARELSTDYAPGGPDAVDPVTNAARTKWGEAVFQPARAMSRELYRRALQQTVPAHAYRQVVFTAGGAGAGKSTAIRQFFGIARMLDAAEVIYDTTLSDFASAMERIGQALAAGRTVTIVMVYRDPIASLARGVFPRAKMTGRMTALGAFINTHLGAIEGVLKIAAVYKNDPRVVIVVIDNTRSITDAAVTDLTFLEHHAGKYSRDALSEQLSRIAKSAYEADKNGKEDGISEVLYNAFNRRSP